jgi:hypothetical protein
MIAVTYVILSATASAVSSALMKTARVVLILLFAGALLAQAPPGVRDDGESSRSLGDVARETKQRATAKSNVVVTDEVLSALRGPFPDIAFEGQDNADQIIAAIEAFQRAHSRPETEAAIRSWYETHDAMLDHAIRENKNITERLQAKRYGPSEPLDGAPRDAKQYRERQIARADSALSERRTIQTNGLRIARLQNDFSKVRTALHRMGLKCEWLKIRCANDNCSY